ncbi:unnamed protein product [Blumeria hordei]|uniref:Uncharacterized protein n=1 Tax=Blumeria hordei TaxID=2867405 RepID=A0A383UT04_BLUHO|nr:unnamed protein product [Blumeria hordei]
MNTNYSTLTETRQLKARTKFSSILSWPCKITNSGLGWLILIEIHHVGVILVPSTSFNQTSY